jgi:phytoene dehydrogenase-like protein
MRLPVFLKGKPIMPKSETDILIIGAGIAGLAAGCYAQMNGYQTQIFELHTIPGGLCTAWERKGYVFDGCLHYLFGTGKDQPFYRLWEELGAVQGRDFIHHTDLMSIIGPDGKTLTVYSDPDRLQDHMQQLSPEDSRLIEAFCKGIKTFTKFDMTLLQQKPKQLMRQTDWSRLGITMLPFAPALAKWGMVSVQDFANRFKDPFLTRAIPQMFGWPGIPVMVGMSLLAYMHNQNAGVPVGASLEFARAIEKRYLDLGGEIHYSSPVERILIENNRAVGIRLYNNEEHRARRVISASDGRSTYFQLLGDKYLDRKIRRLYDGHLPIHSILQVSLGVNRDMSDQPRWMTYLLEQPVLIAGQERYEIGLKNYSYDPSLAPTGKSSVTLMLTTRYEYWQRIYGRRIYDVEQIQESGILIDWLEKIYPGIKSDIEFVDVATPLSYERYTGNWQGSSCGWLLTKETMPLMLSGMRKTLPHVSDFYMAGQWVEPGGSVPVVAMSGRNIIQQICAEDKQEFEATLP